MFFSFFVAFVFLWFVAAQDISHSSIPTCSPLSARSKQFDFSEKLKHLPAERKKKEREKNNVWSFSFFALHPAFNGTRWTKLRERGSSKFHQTKTKQKNILSVWKLACFFQKKSYNLKIAQHFSVCFVHFSRYFHFHRVRQKKLLQHF